MGNARSSVDNLVFLRAWTAAEVSDAVENLRRRKPTMAVDRSRFTEMVGGRNPESMRVFDALDADADGKVDTFEVLMALTLWCSAPWEEKLGLLFRCFDFNRKGALRFPELALMTRTAIQVVGQFMELPPKLSSFSPLRETVAEVFGGVPSGEIGLQVFEQWFDDTEATQQLREVVDRQLAVEASEKLEAPVRERLRLLDYSVQELAQEVHELRAGAEALRAEGAQHAKESTSEWLELWSSFDGLFKRLETAGHTQQNELAELTQAMAAEAASGGAVALLMPEKRAEHSKLIQEIIALEQRSKNYLLQAKVILGHLLEISRAHGDSRPETPSLPLPVVPEPPAGGYDAAGISERRLRVLNRELRRRRGRQTVHTALFGRSSGNEPSPLDLAGAATVSVREATLNPEAAGVGLNEGMEDESMPIVVAFATFDPPPDEETQMLALQPGDEITALGQEGAGWWYGRKADGSEGWFPPSYVQIKQESPKY